MVIVAKRKPKIVPLESSSAARLTEAEARRLREQISGMAIEHVPTESVKPNPTNARKHPKRQILLIAKNMQTFGVTHPILIDEDNMIIGGHARVAAARHNQLKEIPAIRFSNLTEQQKRAVALAENRLAELASWDIDMLRLELNELTFNTAELTFDTAIIGFETAEIDQILVGKGSVRRHDPADEVPPLPAAEDAVTETGDLWVCEDHRLYCGGARDAASYRALMAGEKANVEMCGPIRGTRHPLAGIRPSASTPG